MEGPQVTTEPSGMNVLVGPLAIMSKPVNQAAPATEFFPVQRSRQGSARRILTRVPRNDGIAPLPEESALLVKRPARRSGPPPIVDDWSPTLIICETVH